MECACEMSGSMWWMMTVPIIVLAIVAVVAIFVVRALWGRLGHSSSSRSNPLSILEERYARGEIDHEEFAERRGRLEQPKH